VNEADYRALVSGQRRGPWSAVLRGGLWLASLPYGAAVRTRNWLFESGRKTIHRAGVPVVSVGNLTVGGTGKTPCVEYVARHYASRDLRVAVLSRGYGSEMGRNDEAMVLEENLPDVPHLQGADRVALAQSAVDELESQILILDDGFQHRRLARNLDIVLIDATNPWGYGHLLPRGLLREPRSSLCRAGIAVLTRCDQVPRPERDGLRQEIARLAPGVPISEATHRPVDLANGLGATAALEKLQGRPIAAFCGLGNPEAFRRTLLDLGATVSAFRSFPDHHAYTRADVDDLRGWARTQATDCVVVTTQKDMVKLRLADLGGRELWAVRIRLQFEAGQEEFDQKMEEVTRLVG
jgi:tetraacyldisaccharide 4'-kinase